MGDQDLHKIWDDLLKVTFDQFISQNIGHDETDEMKPKCYGSGDGEPWCNQCTFKSRC